jgi:hypothetical protein
MLQFCLAFNSALMIENMTPLVIVKNENQVYADEIIIGIIGLLLITALMSAVYLKFDHKGAALITGGLSFSGSCFIETFRKGYLALVFWVLGIVILLGAIYLIVIAIIKV